MANAPSTTSKTQDDQTQPVSVVSAGAKEKESAAFESFREAKLQSAAFEAEQVKEQLEKQGLVPSHDQPLPIDQAMDLVGVHHPLQEAEKVIAEQTINIPIDEGELVSKQIYPVAQSVRWLRTKFRWVYKRALRFGRRVLFRGKPPTSGVLKLGV